MMDIDTTKNKKVEDKLNSFIGRNSKVILTIGIVLVVIIVALCIVLVTVQNRTNSRSIRS